jgi:hypothetical protein
MTASKEFQEHLQTGQISEAIALVVGKLVELDVTTNLAATDATPSTSLRTQISLTTGKITTEINPELLNRESAQQLLDFHTAQITATNAVVRDHLHSLRELLQILQGHAPLVATAAIDPQPDVTIPVPFTPAVINSDIEYPVTTAVSVPVPEPDTDTISAVPTTEPPSITPPPGALKTGTGVAAGGMAAAVAQAGSPKLDEADTLPNKFEQVLKSAGVKEEAGNHPFTAPTPSVVITEPAIQPTVVNSTEANLESDPEWDEWLLEEDAILSELSLASEEVAKDKIPDWDEQWFAQPSQPKNDAEDWEQFIPEYVDLDAPAHRGQANVERFRQNLVNDPQLMSELLAELDDIEKLNQDEFPKT